MSNSIKGFSRIALLFTAFIICGLCGCKKEGTGGNNNSNVNMPFKNQSGALVGAGGAAVAISADGKTAVSGDPGLSNGLGGIHVYARNGNNWVLQATLIGTGYSGQYNGTSPRNGSSIGQGTSVAISEDGNTIVSGGEYDGYWGSAAFIFVRSGDSWSQQGPAIDTYFSFSNDLDGTSVSLSGDGNTAIFKGGLSGSSGGIFVSKAFVFTRNGSVWKKSYTIDVDSSVFDNLYQVGTVAVSADGNILAIGKRNYHGSAIQINYDGEIDVYQRSGATWIKQINGRDIKPSIQADINGFGQSLAISANGSAIIAGTEGSNQHGNAYIFTNVLNGPWIQYKDVVTNDIDAAKFNYVGRSVAFSADGNNAVIAGNIIGKDETPGLAGQNVIFYYTLQNSLWIRQGDYILNNRNTDYGYGYALSMSANGQVIMAGSMLSLSGTSIGSNINFFYP